MSFSATALDPLNLSSLPSPGLVQEGVVVGAVERVHPGSFDRAARERDIETFATRGLRGLPSPRRVARGCRPRHPGSAASLARSSIRTEQAGKIA
jgi:hypothetical protein